MMCRNSAWLISIVGYHGRDPMRFKKANASRHENGFSQSSSLNKVVDNVCLVSAASPALLHIIPFPVGAGRPRSYMPGACPRVDVHPVALLSSPTPKFGPRPAYWPRRVLGHRPRFRPVIAPPFFRLRQPPPSSPLHLVRVPNYPACTDLTRIRTTPPPSIRCAPLTSPPAALYVTAS